MISSFKAEFRKLFTVRSTYILIIFSLLVTVLFAFYFEGYKGNTGSPASTLSPTALKEIMTSGAGLGVLFASIIAILFMAHEYRYNMITYTLTANANRSKVLFTKIATISVFGAVYGLVIVLVALGSYLAGLSLRDAELPPQQVELLPELARIVYYYVGYALIGIILAAITRNVVAAIATIFVLSTTIEPLLTLLLKDNAKYLPITALDSTVGATFTQNILSPGMAVVVSAGYLVAGIVVAWLLFLRRDAV
jgi:ABC-2 type transport system permease protein